MPLLYLLIGILLLGCSALLASSKPILAPLVLLAIPAGALLYKKPALGVLALLALVPFEGVFTQQSLFTGAKLVSFALLGVGSLQLALRQLPAGALQSNLWPLIVLYALVWGLSFIFSEHQGASAAALRDVIVGPVLFVLTLLFAPFLNLKMAARVIVLAVAASCMTTLIGDGRLAQDGRSVGLLADPNYFALLIVFAVPLLLLLIRQERHPGLKVFWLLPLAVLIAALFKTESRSAIVVSVVMMFPLAYHYRGELRKVQPRHFGLVVIALFAAMTIGLSLMPASFSERLGNLVTIVSDKAAHQDGSLGRRASYLTVGTEMVKSNPILGSGPGTFAVNYAQTGYATAFSYSRDNPDLYRRAHNTYLDVVSETGIAGLLTFGLLLWVALRNFARARQNASHSGNSERKDQITHFGAAFFALLFFLLFLSALDHKYLWMMLALSSVLLRQHPATVTPEPQINNPKPKVVVPRLEPSL